MLRLQYRIYFVLLVFLFLGACSSLLYFPNSRIYVDSKTLNPPPENLYLENSRGQRLHGWRIPADGQAQVQVLFFHGNAQNLTAHFRYLYWMTEHQVDLVIFDYPGFGQSQGRPSPANTVESGRLFLEKARSLQPGLPIVIFGQSIGSVVALQVLLEETDVHSQICLVVLDSGFVSYQEVARQSLGSGVLSWPLRALVPLVLSDRYAPRERVRDLSHLPFLLVHNEDDPVVSIENSVRIEELHEGTLEFWRIPSQGHLNAFFGAGVESRRLELVSRVTEFCQ